MVKDRQSNIHLYLQLAPGTEVSIPTINNPIWNNNNVSPRQEINVFILLDIVFFKFTVQ